jgi:hypothetical protein
VSAKKRQADDASASDGATPGRKRGSARWMVLAVVLAVVVGGGSYGVRQHVQGHVLASSEYQLEAERITISPLPPWIHGDIKSEVLRDATIDGPLSLLDGELTVRMATAFAAHPWVAHVERVSKQFPSGLNVVLSYRRPVAMVEVEGGSGALPVDIEGVVLPTEGFTADDADAFPLLGEIRTSPSGPVGNRWGDAAVTGGAQIAAALGPDWKSLGLARIVPAGQKAGRAGVEYIFNLVTRSGTQIRWGRAPASDLPGEVPALEKIEQLKRYAAQNNNSLDLPDGALLEIRHDGALVSRPRPDVRPLPQDRQ